MAGRREPPRPAFILTAFADTLRGEGPLLGFPETCVHPAFYRPHVRYSRAEQAFPSWNTRCSIMNTDPAERRPRMTLSRYSNPYSLAFQGKGWNAGQGAPVRSRRVSAGCRHHPLPGRILAGAVRLYQLVLSPLMPPHCRHLPTCSDYAIEALREHGMLRGGWLAIRRIARCHPFGTSGFDPVPARGDPPSRAPS